VDNERLAGKKTKTPDPKPGVVSREIARPLD
jgi:hypothetical protein